MMHMFILIVFQLLTSVRLAMEDVHTCALILLWATTAAAMLGSDWMQMEHLVLVSGSSK